MTRSVRSLRAARGARRLAVPLALLLVAGALAHPAAPAPPPVPAPGDAHVVTDTVPVAVRIELAPGGGKLAVRATVLSGPLVGVALRGSLSRPRPGPALRLGDVARLRGVLDPASGEIRVTATLRDGDTEVRLYGRSHVRALHRDAVRRYWPAYADAGSQRYGLPAPSEPMFLPVPMPFRHA